MNFLKDEYILASASPRRKEILENAGFKIKVIPANVDESIKVENIALVAEKLAERKANEILKSHKENTIIAADTIVIHNHKILEKPKDLEEAKQFLKIMSGAEHQVITGVCVINNHKKVSFSDLTKVSIYDLNQSEIDHYVNNFKVLDKAGAYGIQSWFGLTRVKKIDGCFYNVMGLPMPKLFEILKSWCEGNKV